MAVDPLIKLAEPGAGVSGDDSQAGPILQAEADAALLTRHDVAGHRILGTTVGMGLVIAFVVLAGESTLVALLQSAMLTAISAGLVLSGPAVLARTRSFTLSRSAGIARQARQAAPAGVDRAKRAVALKQPVRQLFPVS